jgi:phosphate transport system protein
MRRREFIAGTAATAALSFAWPACAQTNARSTGAKRLAIFHPVRPPEQLTPQGGYRPYKVYFEELNRLGYIEGQNLIVERYSALGRADRIGDVARQIIASRPDVITVLSGVLIQEIMAMTTKAEQNGIALLALQQPVAGELRTIVSSIQAVADVERMGALAMHVAKIARRRHPQHVLPEEVNGCFAEMGRVAVELGNSAQKVLRTRDPEKAAGIREQDDAMDDLHRQLFIVLMDREWKHGVPAAVDVALLGRFYERFADHAVEVGRRVVFQATGTLPPEQEVWTY